MEAEAAMPGEASISPNSRGYWCTSDRRVACKLLQKQQICLSPGASFEKRVGKFVEYLGPGFEELSLADRKSTVANMAPE